MITQSLQHHEFRNSIAIEHAITKFQNITLNTYNTITTTSWVSKWYCNQTCYHQIPKHTLNTYNTILHRQNEPTIHNLTGCSLSRTNTCAVSHGQTQFPQERKS